MINKGFSNEYVARVTPPQGTETIEYRIWINGTEMVYVGKSGYFGGEYEIDYSDWVEQYRNREGKLKDLTCSIVIDFTFTGDLVDEYYGPTDTITMTYESGVIAPYGFNKAGSYSVRKPTQYGVISGGVVGDVFNRENNHVETIAIFPVFKFFIRRDGEEGWGVLDTHYFGRNPYVDDPTDQVGFFHLEHMIARGTWTWDDLYPAFKEEVLHLGRIGELYLNIPPLYDSPRLISEEFGMINVDRYYGMKTGITPAPPIFYKEYGYQIEGKSIESQVFNFTNEELMDYYYDYIAPYVRAIQLSGGYDLTLRGVAFKTFTLYGEEPAFDEFQSPTVGIGLINQMIPSECSTAHLVLCDCGYTIGQTRFPHFDVVAEEFKESFLPSSVIVPLKVKNNMLAGKTINNLDKTTYIDRYGNTHNASMTNTWELECYIDPDWILLFSGYDYEYEDIMLACQNAKTSYITLENVQVSGCTGVGPVKGRVKDIEKIETHSSYSNNKKVPTYKITFECYR